jgi:hypothetical protein
MGRINSKNIISLACHHHCLFPSPLLISCAFQISLLTPNEQKQQEQNETGEEEDGIRDSFIMKEEHVFLFLFPLIFFKLL